MQTVLGVAPVTAPSTNQSCTWPARNSAKPRSEDVTFWFSWFSCCDTAYRKSKPLLWGEHSLSYCSCPSCCAALQQRATGWAVHRETPLLSSQVHDCPWQADGSLALAQRCLWSCLNNSSLRGRASLSKGMLHWELTATSPHSASSSYETCVETRAAHLAALQTAGRMNKSKCLTQSCASFCSWCLQCCCWAVICSTNPALICSKHRNRYCSLAGSAAMHSNES